MKGKHMYTGPCKFALLIWLALSLVGLAGCGPGNGTPPFAWNISPLGVTTAAGDTATFMIDIGEASNDAADGVHLSVVTPALFGNGGTYTLSNANPGANSSVSLSVAVPPGTEHRQYVGKVKGYINYRHGGFSPEQEIFYYITVPFSQGVIPAFTVDVSPPTHTFDSYNTKEFEFVIRSENGFSGTLDLALVGVGTGTGVNIVGNVPATVTIGPGSDKSGTFTLSQLGGTPGVLTAKLRASQGSTVVEKSFTLTLH